MGMKFSELINKEKRQYQEVKEIRKTIKVKNKEDIIIYNPTFEKREKYLQCIIEFNKKYPNQDKRMSSLAMFISGIKSFTNMEMDCNNIEEYMQIISYAEKDCIFFDELRECILDIEDEINNSLEEIDKMAKKLLEQKQLKEKSIKDMDAEELREYIEKNNIKNK